MMRVCGKQEPLAPCSQWKASTGRSIDHGHRLRVVEILGESFEFLHELLGECVVLHVDRRDELVGLLRELQRLPLFVTGQRADFGHEFAHGERLGQPLGRAFQFVFLEQKVIGLHAFAHVAQRFVGHRVERAHGRRHPGAFLEQVLGVLADVQLGVAVGEDRAVEARGHEHMLKTALEKELQDERLELDLRLEISHAAAMASRGVVVVSCTTMLTWG